MSGKLPDGDSVADVVGSTVARQGVEHAFGVLGSGNLIVTNALCTAGTHFHHARHETGAVAMADGYSRVTGRVGVCSVHQGPGLTNSMTALAEASKSRTPMLVLAGDAPAAALASNFRIDQDLLVSSVDAIPERVHAAKTAADDAQRAYHRAFVERRPVVLMLATDVQSRRGEQIEPSQPPPPTTRPPEPNARAISDVADLLSTSQRPAIIAGRGAVLAGAREALEELAACCGAILATSAPANGLFAGLPFAVGISGGFACPLAVELFRQADVVLAFGASLNRWTTRHGDLIAPGTRVAQIDVESRAFGLVQPVDLAVVGDASAAASALRVELERRAHANIGFRTPEIAQQIATRHWQSEPYVDASTDEWIDPRTLSISLNAALPAERSIAVDTGHFLGYPSMYLDVPDARSWVFPNGFQAVGVGLGTAIGAALADRGRLTVAAIGDGGAFMSLPELETASRLHLGNLAIVIYDDRAYGAEVHHFGPLGHDVSLVRFPDADLASIAEAAGTTAATVSNPDGLDVVDRWLNKPTGRPLVLDAKVNPELRAEWLDEAFRAG